MYRDEEEIRARLGGESQQEESEKKRNAVKYLAVTTVIALMMAIAMAVWRDIQGQTDVAGVFRVLSDSFLVPGAAFSCVGGLTWVASYGFFDMMSYGCSSVFGRFIPFDSAYRRKEKFYDYREKKEKQGRTWNKDMVIVGCVFILLSILFSVIYSAL